MVKYDPEFEQWWGDRYTEPTIKDVVYEAWQAARAPQQPEVKPLELKGGGWFISESHTINRDRSTKNYREAGRERATKELAEAAADKMRKRDRLHAFATEFMGDEYQWVYNKDNYYLYFSHTKERWAKGLNDLHEVVGVIYMTKECAEYLCAALNDGRLVL
jgi:hypothetical protein